MKAKFITVKGSEHLGHEPFYLGILQHERTMSRKEAYEYIAGRTGYTATAVRAVFMAVAEYIRENQARGNVTYIDGKRLRSGDDLEIATIGNASSVTTDNVKIEGDAIGGRKTTLSIEDGKLLLNIQPVGFTIIFS